MTYMVLCIRCKLYPNPDVVAVDMAGAWLGSSRPAEAQAPGTEAHWMKNFHCYTTTSKCMVQLLCCFLQAM